MAVTLRTIEQLELTPTSEVELEHVFVDMRVHHRTDQGTVHNQGFTDHPRHLTQPEVVHQKRHLKYKEILLNTIKYIRGKNLSRFWRQKITMPRQGKMSKIAALSRQKS